jgi:excinuclease ABC subunit B
MKEEMQEAAENLDFERAAELRDSIEDLEEQLAADDGSGEASSNKASGE